MITRILTVAVIATGMTFTTATEAEARPMVRRVAPVRRAVAVAPVRRVATVAPVRRVATVAPVARVTTRAVLPPYPVARRAVVGPVYGGPVYGAPVYHAPVYHTPVYRGGVGVYTPGVSVSVGY